MVSAVGSQYAAALLRGGGAGGADAPTQTAAPGTDETADRDPATIINLSNRAKALLKRADTEQKVADRLEQLLTTSSGDTSTKDRRVTFEDLIGAKAGGKSSSSDPAGEARASEILAKYGDLPMAEQWAANARADNLGMLQDGLNGFDLRRMEGFARELKSGQEVRLGQETMSEDEQFVQSIQLRLASEIVDLDDAGLTDKAQALRDAIGAGTIKVQKSDDVPELHLNYSVSHFGDAGGGGTMSSWSWNPTGEAKAALDGRQAVAIGGVDRGAFFISW